MKKFTIIISLFFIFIFPQVSKAQTATKTAKTTTTVQTSSIEESVKKIRAEIISVEKNFIRAEDDQKNRYSIDKNTKYTLAGSVHKGDEVILKKILTKEGNKYIISSFVRYDAILVLLAIFILVLLLVNGKRGLKSVVNLVVTYVVILLGIIPLILAGWPPILVAVLGGMAAMTWNVYLTHGFSRKSHATILGIASSLLIVGVVGWIFIKYASLSGSVEEGANILSAVGYEKINFRGLLLAAILIGALGVLDDLIISQVSVVQELKENNPDISKTKLFTSAMRVGHDHTSAIVNTLVLAYTSASFPLVILFSIGSPPFTSLTSTLNNETVATEIVRMLVGGIAILLSMPLATIIATYLLTKE